MVLLTLKTNMHNQAGSPNQLPSFGAPGDIDRVPDVSEQELVTQSLDSVVTDCMLNHVDDVRSYDTIGGFSSSYLMFEGTVDSSNLHIEVINNTLPEEPSASYNPSEFPYKEIFIQAGNDTSEEGANIIIYRTHADGVTRRWVTNMDNEFHAAIAADAGSALVEMFGDPDADYGKNIPKPLHEGAENIRLERALGTNDQPATYAEIESLANLLQRPELTVYHGPNRQRIPPNAP